MRFNILKLAIFLGALFQVLGVEPGETYGIDFGVVVNKANPVEDLSLKEVEKIFKAEKLFWDHGKKIVLLLPEAGSPEKKALLGLVYKVSDEELKQFWLTKIFRNEIPLAPKVLASNTAVIKFVEKVEGAIGLVRLNGPIENDVKIIRINGKLPGEPGYEMRLE